MGFNSGFKGLTCMLRLKHRSHITLWKYNHYGYFRGNVITRFKKKEFWRSKRLIISGVEKKLRLLYWSKCGVASAIFLIYKWQKTHFSFVCFHFNCTLQFGKNKGCNSYRKIQQDATVYQHLLFSIYMKLNMFRATYRPSSGA